MDSVVSTEPLPYLVFWYQKSHLGPHASVQALAKSIATPLPSLKRTTATHMVVISTIPRNGFPHPAVSLAQILLRFATAHAVGGHIEVTNVALQTIASTTGSNLAVAVLFVQCVTPEAERWIAELRYDDDIEARVERHISDEEYALINKYTLMYMMQTTG